MNKSSKSIAFILIFIYQINLTDQTDEL